MKLHVVACMTATLGAAALLAAQTNITPPSNSYSLTQDVEMGRQAADEARKQLPLLKDEAVSSYVSDLGRRLVVAIPPEFQHQEFHYSFETVNVRDINAFALPGGPMFVNRGMIEAAQSEGEVAGVMAHEISHVVLRHGTAQASRANKYQVGQLAGAVLGAIIGGTVGSVVAEGTRFGIGSAFLRYSRDYERQADIEGAHIMARAGYDPREMANMFKTIEKQGSGGGPEWLSDHPNPGNRSEYITKEAALLRVDNPIGDKREFQDVRAELARLPKAPTTEEVTRNAARTSSAGSAGPTSRSDTPRQTNIEPPASQLREYDEGGRFRVSVPANWREQQDSNVVTFAPAGAYAQGAFTHGVQFGITRNETHDVEMATDELIDSLARSNQKLSRISGYSQAAINGHRGVETMLGNVSEITGAAETIQIATVMLKTGGLFYVIAVAPTADVPAYQTVFRRVVGSIRLND